MFRSWDAESNSRGLGASIRRSASDLKSRLFSASGKSRGPGLRLADLTECRLQGYLQYKVKANNVPILYQAPSYDRQTLASPSDSVFTDLNLLRAILIRDKSLSNGKIKVCLLP